MRNRPALAALSAGLLVLFSAVPAHAGADDARRALARSLALLEAGNISAARRHADAAIKADPGWGLAHAVRARVFVALGDGVGAEAELGRAKAAGFDTARTHQILAHAWLLQGAPKRAIAEAARAQPRFAGYARRVTARALAMQGDLPAARAALLTLVAAAPGDSAAWSDLGRLQFSGGDVAGAIDSAARANALDRGNIEALVLRGELVRGQYGLVAALPWFEAALRHDPYFHPALIEYAATLGDVGRYGEMLAASRRALEIRPDSAQAFYLQAVLAARAGNDALARALLQRTAGRLDDLPGVLLLGGTLDFAAGGYQQAIGKWGELVARQPLNLTARRLLGAALLRSGDAAGALAVLRPVADRADADSYALTLVGRAFERSGARDWAAGFLDRAAFPRRGRAVAFRTDDGLAALRSATGRAPGDPVRAIGYLRGLVETGQGSAALTAAQDVARANPGAPAATIAVGDTLMAMARPADAANVYMRAARVRFDEPVMLRLVDALDRAGRGGDAANALALFVSQNPRNIAALRLAAHWQVAAGEWTAAIDTLEGLRARIGNRDAALLAELAYAYLGDDDPATARSFASAAYALAPLNPAAADAYGWALYQTGANRAARQLLEKAVSIAPEHAVLRWHLGQVYAELGGTAAARAQIAVALRDPSFTDRAAAAAVLRSLG